LTAQPFFASSRKSDVICISEVIDISPGDLDSSLCFLQPSISMMYYDSNLGVKQLLLLFIFTFYFTVF